MRLTVYFCFIFLIFNACVPLEQTGSSNTNVDGKRLVYDNFAYEQTIKTVRLYPDSQKPQDQTLPAVVPLSQVVPLFLEFDDLGTESENFNAKIIHCDADWKKSSLKDMEYLYDFNEYPINDYQLSFNTRTSFVHYSFTLPKVKFPGNYIIKVYRGRNENDLILSQRFMVYDQRASIASEIKISSEVRSRRTNQQLIFSVNYGGLEILNPSEDVKVVIRQNQRWDNAILNLKPTFIKENQNILEYEHFTAENEFPGGNEFRFFDLRTLNFPGQNVADINLKTDKIDAILFKDRSRGEDVYGQYNDINGQFVIANLEAGGGKVESDYVNVHFFLDSEEVIKGDVFVSGGMTDWKYTSANKMEYDPENKQYYLDLLLKQGFYNFLYIAKGNDNPYAIEGSFFETENKYEIFVYNRPMGSRADLLIAYSTIDYNVRER